MSKDLWGEVQSQMRSAYAEKDETKARKRLLTTARWLDRVAPAAGSLREGLEETLTVASLRLPATLVRAYCRPTLSNHPFNECAV